MMEVGLFEPVTSLRYSLDGHYKSFGSGFLGTPIEMEMAMGTACFLARNGQSCKFDYKGCSVVMKTYGWTDGEELDGLTKIASVFPGVVRGTTCKNNL